MDQAEALRARWRAAVPDDAGAIGAVERAVHTLGAERAEVVRERITLFGAGCRVLEAGEAVVGYGLAYPWRSGTVPRLDRFLGALDPAADLLFIHDVAILPAARGDGAGARFVDHARALARHLGLRRLALVSVYGTAPYWARHGFGPMPAADLAGYGDTAIYMEARLAEAWPVASSPIRRRRRRCGSSVTPFRFRGAKGRERAGRGRARALTD